MDSDDSDESSKRASKYMSELSSKLNEFRSSGTLCDVKIHVGTRSFHVHKAILCAASDYFLAMFTSGFKENSLQEVHIEGNGDTFAQVLNYMYTGKLQTKLNDSDMTNISEVVEIFQMAAYLQLGNILEMCKQFLMDSLFCVYPRHFWESEGFYKIEIDEVLVIWQLADAHDFQDVSTKCSQCVLYKLLSTLDESEHELINKGVSCGQILKCLDDTLLREFKPRIIAEDFCVDRCFWLKVLEYQHECHSISSLEYPQLRRTLLSTMKDNESMEDSKDNGSMEDSKDNGSMEDSKDNESMKDSKDNGSMEDSKDNGSMEDSKDNEPMEDSKYNGSMEDSKDNEPMEDSKDNESMEDSKDNGSMEDSKDNEPMEDSKDNEPMEDSKDNEPMEDSKYDINLVSNIVNWIAYDWSRRSCNAAEILAKVGLGCLSVERLTKIVDHRFEGIPECKAVLDRLIVLKSSQDSFQLKLSCPDLFCSRTMLVGQIAVKWMRRSCHLRATVYDHGASEFAIYRGDSEAKYRFHSCEALLNVNGRLYSSRGYSDLSCQEVNTFTRYHVEIKRWICLEPMLYPRNKHAMVYLKDNIYVIGGAFYDKGDLYFSVMCQRYNVCREDWNMVADLPENVEYPCAVAFKGMLIVVGQRHIVSDMVECVIQVYNPNSDQWFLQEALTKFKQPSDPRFRSRFPKCKLSVQNGECYQIWYQSVSENDREGDGLYVSHVCKLVCDFDGEVPVVAIGEKVNQSMIPPNKQKSLCDEQKSLCGQRRYVLQD
ncbi:uncharacterized protein [Amphiura filiformis]|uniref:uncharacterized protein n=1 Tax=Amphiura filiformis TaxID=82378 RepID=UPI003B20E69C